jgi:glucose uptake protein
MVVVESYAIAVYMCVITMLCWGSWANTQKMASKEWSFQLFYWDYSIGVLLLSLVLAFTMGSFGSQGRGFIEDLLQADGGMLWTAFVGGVVFNFANILLVAAIAIAGMSVAFPVGIGIALALGVFVNYIAKPEGNPVILFVGVALVVIAIILDALAYRRLQKGSREGSTKGLIISIIAGISMGFFYRFVADSMVTDFVNPEAGLLTPYTAVVVFSVGLVVSSIVFVTVIMYKPIAGDPVSPGDYIKKGNPKLHMIGIAGGAIWSLGMAFSIIAAGAAGPAIAYGLGQGATMVAALWGVFVWKEFNDAPKGTNKLIAAMFVFFIAGLGLIIAARVM